MTTIARATRYGRSYRVVCACGHAFDISLTEFARRQLYIGKRIACEICALEKEINKEQL